MNGLWGLIGKPKNTKVTQVIHETHIYTHRNTSKPIHSVVRWMNVARIAHFSVAKKRTHSKPFVLVSYLALIQIRLSILIQKNVRNFFYWKDYCFDNPQYRFNLWFCPAIEKRLFFISKHFWILENWTRIEPICFGKIVHFFFVKFTHFSSVLIAFEFNKFSKQYKESYSTKLSLKHECDMEIGNNR